MEKNYAWPLKKYVYNDLMAYYKTRNKTKDEESTEMNPSKGVLCSILVITRFYLTI